MPERTLITLDEQPAPAAPGPLRVALVTSRYNAWVTESLQAAALDALDRHAIARHADTEAVVIPASGSLEIPALCAEAAMSGAAHAVVALGCIIRGQTEHDRHIARAIIHNLTDLASASGVPIGIGVLTVNTPEQAEARAGGELGNKGAEAMDAALDSLANLRKLRAWLAAQPDAASGASE